MANPRVQVSTTAVRSKIPLATVQFAGSDTQTLPGNRNDEQREYNELEERAQVRTTSRACLRQGRWGEEIDDDKQRTHERQPSRKVRPRLLFRAKAYKKKKKQERK